MTLDTLGAVGYNYLMNSRRLDAIKQVIAENRAAGRSTYAGLDSGEIGQYNRWLMFGDDDVAFPDVDTWSSIVD
jgi:hypothetical protein